MKTWTLKTLAKELGVSIATMSNAYNRPDQLSPQLRERLLQHAAALGYMGPSAAASSLRTGKTKVIGVMLSHPLSYGFSDPLAGQFLEGIASVLEQKGMSILVLSSRIEQETLAGYVSLVDGFIIYGPPLESILDFMKKQPNPVITVDFEVDDMPSITLDDYEGAYKIAKYCSRPDDVVAIMGLRLLESDKVVNIAGKKLNNEHFITIQRLQGMINGAAANGVEIYEEDIWHVPENLHEIAREAAFKVLQSKNLPNLILCQSDRIGLAVMEVAKELGINVPKQVRVTGFDDIPESKVHFPGLTTVRQDGFQKGILAAQTLLGDRPFASVRMQTLMQVRMSSLLPMRK